VHHTRPTVPHQLCPSPDVPEVAHPVGEAARHGKKALHKKSREISALERPAAHSPRQAAQVVADSGLARRTVMRDEGKSPLAPPGVQRYQPWPRMAASVERVMAAQPSARLTRLSRRRSVWHVCQNACAPLVIRFSWSQQSAHRVKAHTRVEAAQPQLWTCVHALSQSGLPTALWRVVTSREKITLAGAPHLCEDWKPPLRPRTNHALERLSGRLKTSRRHSTGRQNPHACSLRAGRFGAIRLGLPEPTHWVDACARLHANDVHQILHLLRHPEKRRKCWYTRPA